MLGAAPSPAIGIEGIPGLGQILIARATGIFRKFYGVRALARTQDAGTDLA